MPSTRMLSRAYQGRRLEAAHGRGRNQLFKRLIRISWIAIDGVVAVAFDADAADRHAVFVNRQATGIG